MTELGTTASSDTRRDGREVGQEQPGMSELVPFEALDRTVTIEMRRSGQPRGYVPTLYSAARGPLPITYEIARSLMGVEGSVVIVTGVYEKTYFPYGETDGPVGAFVLARALAQMGSRPAILIERQLAAAFEAMSRAAGFSGYDLEIVTTDDLESGAIEQWAETKFAAAVTIEALGANELGTMHTTSGIAYSTPTASYGDRLVRSMNRLGKPTIGIGDGGNEIGFGAIKDAVLSSVPYAGHCKCPCGAGLAASTATSHLFPVAVSNWGAYAVVAALALCSENPSLTYTPEEEKLLLEAVAAAGCHDGITLEAVPRQDGISLETSMAIVSILQEIMTQARMAYSRPI